MAGNVDGLLFERSAFVECELHGCIRFDEGELAAIAALQKEGLGGEEHLEIELIEVDFCTVRVLVEHDKLLLLDFDGEGGLFLGILQVLSERERNRENKQLGG